MKDEKIGIFETFFDGKRHLLSLPKDWNSKDDQPLKFEFHVKSGQLVIFGPKVEKGGKK